MLADPGVPAPPDPLPLPVPAGPVPVPPPRRLLGYEVLLVLGVSLGASAVYSLVSLIGSLTASKPLAQQSTTLNPSVAPGRPWLDLTYQVLGIATALVPVLLAGYLLGRDPGPAVAGTHAGAGVAVVLGLRPRALLVDLGTGALLAAAIGVPGLALYRAAVALGLNVTVVPAALPRIWWALPVLVLSAIQNAVLEEVVVVGYLMTRLRQLRIPLPAVVALSAILRGSYHLYQGFGGFLGNAVMGLVFGLFYLRVRRVGPLVAAHALIDTVAFVGYALFASRLGFLR